MKRKIVLSICAILAAVSMSPAYAKASSISAGIINPNTNVPAGTTITFQITPEYFINTPSYTISDSFPGSTISNSSININGWFSWTPQLADVGTHNVTITATDSYGNKSTITQTFVVGQYSTMSVQSLSPGSSVFPNRVMSFIIAAPGFNNPSFSIGDSFSGSTILSNSTISASGIVTWTPKPSDTGVHNLALNVVGTGNRTGTVYQTITVNGITIKNISSASLTPGNLLTFTIVPYGLNNPTYRVSDSFVGNTLANTGTLDGTNFSWRPQTADIGTHVISVQASDVDGNVGTTEFVIIVTSGQASQTTPEQKPPITSKYLFKNPLSVGSSGKDVTELQKRLTDEGVYSGAVTGYFGSLTKQAVMHYQKIHGLSQLGNVGPGTRAALNK